MALHLTLAPTSGQLADALAGELSRVPADPFTAEVIAVPGDGVRAWLSAALSAQLGRSEEFFRSATPGAQPDGIVANVEFVFPAGLIRRALDHDRISDGWDVGHLTWAVHQVLHEQGDRIGLGVIDAVRCRNVADLLDRYALHRTDMVRAWERQRDVDPGGRELPDHLLWQPRLWRAVCELLGHPSGPARVALATNELRLGRIHPDLPGRVFLVGLASLPRPHLGVLMALAQRIEVHVLAPTWSPVVWERVLAAAAAHRTPLPIDRTDDPTAAASRHPVGATWGRAPREAQLLLAQMAVESGVQITQPDPERRVPGLQRTGLLAQIQDDLRADRQPPGPPAIASDDARWVLRPGDHSIQWHRCHGPARQAEVLRDVIVRTLDEVDAEGTPRFEPRDIAVLCTDPATFAPLVEAAFAGDPEHGIPPIPLRIADRSLREDTPLLATAGALLGLLDGRFRASDVLAFAALAPVRAKFGFDADRLGTVADWAQRTNVRWGLDTTSRKLFGVPPDVAGHTWESGLDQALVGAVMADPDLAPEGLDVHLGPGETVPLADVEGDDVDTLGAIADLVHELRAAVDRLGVPLAVGEWCDALATSIRALCALDDADAWQWRQFDQVVSRLADEAVVNGVPSPIPVPPGELATLLAGQLDGGPGRVRFGTGAVTLSSLTAQRGVPHRVVCLLGIDGDLSAGVARADDLTAIVTCVGDRDPRSELRAQLLDAILAAGERLVITSTGHDLRTNTPVPPSVPLAELADLIDATAVVDGQPAIRASQHIAVDHPRHAWSARNFRPGELGVDQAWSFDRGALEAAEVRRGGAALAPLLSDPLPPEPPTDLRISDVEIALRNPVQALLAGRLGVHVADRSEIPDDLIPLSIHARSAFDLRDRLLSAQLAGPGPWDPDQHARWETIQRRSGCVPPGDLGSVALAEATAAVGDLVDAATRACGPSMAIAPIELAIDLDLGPRRLTGAVSGVRGDVLVEVRASRLRAGHTLAAWFRLMVLTCAHPDRQWETAVIGLGADKQPAVERMRVRSLDEAQVALEVVIDLYDRSRRTLIPVLANTSRAVFDGGLWSGSREWSSHLGFGDGDDRWVCLALGQLDYAELVLDPPRADEAGDGWGTAPSRLERWSQRIWGTVERSVERGDPADAPTAAATSIEGPT